MKKLSVFLLCCFAFAGCRGAAAQEAASAPSPAFGETGAASFPDSTARTLYFYAHSDELSQETASFFAQKARQLSGGALDVRVEASPDPSIHFDNGNSHFLLAGSRQLSSIVPSLQTLLTPYLFTGYEHLTMTLNDPETIRIVAEEFAAIDAYSLAGLYGGAGWLLSDGDFISANTVRGLSIGIAPNNRLAAVLTAMGMEVSEMSDAERVQMFLDGNLNMIECPPARAQTVLTEKDLCYQVSAFTYSNPIWLLMDRPAFDSLSPAQQAALVQSASYLIPAYDNNMLGYEDNLLAGFLDKGGRRLEGNAFSSYRRQFSTQLLEQSRPDGVLNRRLLAIAGQTQSGAIGGGL